MSSPKPFSNIVVVGGTPFDSAKGANYLRTHGINASAIGISTEPAEQSALYQHPDLVKQRFDEKVNPTNCSEIIVFCNSLSFVVPWREIYPTKIYELTAYYKAIFTTAKLKTLAVIVAEETTITNLKDFVLSHGICDPNDLKIFSRLDIINQLEALSEKDQLRLLRKMIKEYQNLGFTEILMGCTHLDQEEFEELTDVKVYQPGLTMLREFINDHTASR
tara:strand:- start:129 stop:785 length:657 start_codon:yes stop_codon:yes gene_type:complete